MDADGANLKSEINVNNGTDTVAPEGPPAISDGGAGAANETQSAPDVVVEPASVSASPDVKIKQYNTDLDVDGPVSNDRSNTPGTSSRKKKKQLPPDAHKVTFTVTVVKAVPTVEEDEVPVIDEQARKKRKVVDAPRAQVYYHTEYHLLPTDNEPIKTDIVTFGLAAKVYTDRQDPKVVKTWQEGDRSWIAWTHTHSVQVTADLLKKLHQHTLQLRIWDTKEKCSTRAKFDRPKAFRLPQSKNSENSDETNGVRALVLQQAQTFADSQPKHSYMERPLPAETPSLYTHSSQLSASRPVSSKHGGSDTFDQIPGRGLDSQPGPVEERLGHVSPTPNTLVSIPNRDLPASDASRSYSRLGKLAGMSAPSEAKSKSKSGSRKHAPSTRGKQQASLASKSENKASLSKSSERVKAAGVGETENRPSVKVEDASSGPVQDPSQTKKSKKNDPAAQLLAEHVKKNGIAVVPVRMADLYAGCTSVTGRLDTPVASVNDLIITVSIDCPLMSDEQLKMLNPLILTLQSVSHMPDTPMSHLTLTQQCQPVTCHYKLFKQPTYYKTRSRPHGPHVHFNDVNVFLLGTMNRESVCEYLLGPLLEIEIHDRDMKAAEKKSEPMLFGYDFYDEKLSNVGMVTSRRTTHNPFTERDNRWDPYGLVKFDLSGLLNGERLITYNIPVQPCNLPDILDSTGDGVNPVKLVGIPNAIDGPVDPPLAAGEYLHAGTTLKLRVDLAVSLVKPTTLTTLTITTSDQPKIEISKCPFGRLVAIFDYKNLKFLNNLLASVTSINAQTLGLDNMPCHVIQFALATYKLSREEQASRTLDILTGFHVMDGVRHIVILEGLYDQALKRVCDDLPEERSNDVRVLYNADLQFSARLYQTLDIDVSKVKLHEPLDNLVQKSLLYVRDIVPKLGFQGMTKIYNLLSLKKLRDIVRNDLFPTAEMIQSMSKVFGVPISGEDFEDDLGDEQRKEGQEGLSSQVLDVNGAGLSMSRYPRWTPLDTFNQDFLQYLQQRDEMVLQTDYINANKADVKSQSAKNHEEREKNRKTTVSATVRIPHNYSTQSLNSMEASKEKLRQILTQSPDTLYTYCPTYHHSMTVLPVNLKSVKIQEAKMTRWKCKTTSGWSYPGMKPSVADNEHKPKLDQARIDELSEEWQENALHSAVLKSTMLRDAFPWRRRHTDMDIWTKPKTDLNLDVPCTIHLAGDALEEEHFLSAAKDYEKWKSRVCVDSMEVKCHRCLPATEMTNKGLRATNQLAKLEGILKDPAKKHGIRYPGIHTCPVLSVIKTPFPDSEPRSKLGGEKSQSSNGYAYGPGPFEYHSWAIAKNTIPLRNYEHEKFAEQKGHDFNVYHKTRSMLSHKRCLRPLSKQIDPDTWNIPRVESYTHTDDVEYWPPGALKYVQRQLMMDHCEPQQQKQQQQQQQQQQQHTVEVVN